MGLSATAFSSVIACGQLSVDAPGDKVQVPISPDNIHVRTPGPILLEQYIHLNQFNPDAFSKMAITADNFEGLEPTFDDDGIETDIWTNGNGASFSKTINNGVISWEFQITTTQPFVIELVVTAPNYLPTILTITYQP